MSEDRITPLPETGHIDLSSMTYMPLMIKEFVASRLVNGVKSIYSINNLALCASAFHQVPAGSVPDDDIEIATMSGFRGSDEEFQQAKAVILRGFIKHADNRWYHPFVVRRSIEIWDKNEHQRERYRSQTEKANEARRRAAAERREMRGYQGRRDGQADQDAYRDYPPVPAPAPDMAPGDVPMPREAAGTTVFQGLGASASAQATGAEIPPMLTPVKQMSESEAYAYVNGYQNGFSNGRVCDIDGQSIDGDVTYDDDDCETEISARDDSYPQAESPDPVRVTAAENLAWTEEDEENQSLKLEQQAVAERDCDAVCDNDCNVIVEDPNININLIKKVSKKESPYSPPRGDETEATLFGDQGKGQGQEDGRIEVPRKSGPSMPIPQKPSRSRRPSMPLSDELEMLWSAFKTCYPPRTGSPNWGKAKEYFVENIKRGKGADVLIKAAQAYYQNSVEDGRVSDPEAKHPFTTSYVMQASTFLNPNSRMGEKTAWEEVVDDFERRKATKASGGTVTRIETQRAAGTGKPFHRPEPPPKVYRGPWA